MKPEDLDDFILWAAIGVVVGGRLGYILFYDFQRYFASPLEIFAVWKGGMSFHGGFAGTTLAMILFARSRGIKMWTLFDVVAAGAPVALGTVRCANFINSELWGRVTDVPWASLYVTNAFFRLLRGLVPPAPIRVIPASFTRLRWKVLSCSSCCAC